MDIETKIKEEATFWAMCEKDGLDENQKKEFGIWLENPNNQKAYNRIKFIHNISKSISKENKEKLGFEAHQQISKGKFYKKLKTFSTLAASLFFCIIAFKVYDSNFKVQFSQTYITDTTPIKEQLLDGSNIFIDAKTNLDIEFFDGKRVVTLLDGRALFEVAKDENRPFIVKSDDINIEVIGTKFEVIHKKDTTTINVENGVVRTYYSKYFIDKQNPAILTKSQSVTYENNIGNIEKIEDIKSKKIASWTQNRVVLDKTKLKDALDEFSKYSDISFSFLSDDVENYLVTGEFLANQSEIFLKTITQIYPIKIDKKGKELEISKKF